MEKILTAEDFLYGILDKRRNLDNPMDFSFEEIEELLIQFCKLHVKAALEAAFNNTGFVKTTSGELNSQSYKPFITDENSQLWTIDKESILSAYPENLIV